VAIPASKRSLPLWPRSNLLNSRTDLGFAVFVSHRQSGFGSNRLTENFLRKGEKIQNIGVTQCGIWDSTPVERPQIKSRHNEGAKAKQEKIK